MTSIKEFLGLDDSPLDSDWDDIHDLWNDIKKFARTHPDHVIMAADDPGCNHEPPRVPRLGWSAFRENYEDEQAKYWTITIRNLKRSTPRLYNDEAMALRRGLETAKGRRKLAELVSGSV